MTKKYYLLAVLLFTGLLSSLVHSEPRPVKREDDRALRFLVRMLGGVEKLSPEFKLERTSFQNDINDLAEQNHQLMQKWRRDKRKTEDAKALSEELRKANVVLFRRSVDRSEKFLENLLKELRANRDRLEEVMLP